MIKVIAFDMVGVLVGEKNIELSKTEEKLERLFGDNYSDSDYINEARKIVDNDQDIIKITEDLINKLYVVKDKDLFKKIKDKYPDIKIVIATNHVSFIRRYIEKYLDIKYLNNIFISAEINIIKPNKDFYEHILNSCNINPQELLFIDDNINNTKGAEQLGIKTIIVDKNTNLFEEIKNMV